MTEKIRSFNTALTALMLLLGCLLVAGAVKLFPRPALARSALAWALENGPSNVGADSADKWVDCIHGAHTLSPRVGTPQPHDEHEAGNHDHARE